MEMVTNAQGQAWGLMAKALPYMAKDKVLSVAKTAKRVGQDDPRRVIHSLKVGLALTIVSLIYYAKPLYDDFGVAGMWAVLTVVLVFEFTVGGTLSKSINRGFATILAGALALGSQYFASLFGEKAEPIVLGILVFILAGGATFSRFMPGIKARYDYGVLIFIMTFSLVAVSGYRVEELLVLAHQRVSTILIGAATCMFISIFVCPVWAGEDLQKLVASNLDKLAHYLQGFGGVCIDESSEDGGAVGCKDGKAFLQEYKTVLNSKSTEESLANLARWEQLQGRFRRRYPWKQYLKIGALARHCAYQIEAINSYINSNFQLSQEFQFQGKIEESCKRMSSECGKALEALATAIKAMVDPSPASFHIRNSQSAMEDLKIALKSTSFDGADLLSILPSGTVASILIEIVHSVEKISESVHELSNLANFKTVEPTVSPKKPPQLLHRGTVEPVLDGESAHVVVTINKISSNPPENEKPK